MKCNFHTFLHKKKTEKKQMTQCVNACIKSMDKITETPDVNGLLTLHIRDSTVFTNQIKVNSN